MIHSQDRSGWFGASDTATIMGNRDTLTFAQFWMEKNGIIRRDYNNAYMKAGTYFEYRILDELGIKRRDRQIKIRRLRLRVNLDGETWKIHEVKTHKGEYKVSRQHWMQAQVEMFAARKPLEIVSYRMEPEDYRNYFLPIDLDRLSFHPVEYDPAWVEKEYLPRLKHLAECLRTGARPCLKSL